MSSYRQINKSRHAVLLMATSPNLSDLDQIMDNCFNISNLLNGTKGMITGYRCLWAKATSPAASQAMPPAKIAAPAARQVGPRRRAVLPVKMPGDATMESNRASDASGGSTQKTGGTSEDARRCHDGKWPSQGRIRLAPVI